MHGFNRLEWKGTEGYKTHTHKTVCGIVIRNVKFTCLNIAVSNHLQ